MINDLPKVLIVSRCVWDDAQGTSSTLSNLFADYDPERLAHIYIETKQPNTRCCHHFFQISEFSLVHKLWHWRLATGHVIDSQGPPPKGDDEKIAEQESKVMNFVRGHRSFFFSFLREVLWWFNGWKSRELRDFIQDFNADVIWIDGSPLPLMNRLSRYVLKIAMKPASIFMQDDIYTYEGCRGGLFSKLGRWYLRRKVFPVVKSCDNMFVASPKMKLEYDRIFNLDSIFIAKSIDYDKSATIRNTPHTPIRMVYLGQVIYGRIYSLIAIAETLAKINKEGLKIHLSIYTNNLIPENQVGRLLLDKESVSLEKPVPYYEVKRVISENDVVVFVESFEPSYCKVARLSFSTKISDYLASGKCIFAVGPDYVAPIEYLVEEDAAIVATNAEEIEERLHLLSESNTIMEYSLKANQCAKRNHDRNKMNKIIYDKLKELAKKKNVYERN